MLAIPLALASRRAPTDRVDFAEFNLAAKLARWGTTTHMGSMFGPPNQIALIVTALGIAAMVVSGYLMWWKRRPTRGFAKPAPAGAIVHTPWWSRALVFSVALTIGVIFPPLGASLVAFIVVDGILEMRPHTDRT